MMLVRVIALIAKPALVGGAVAAISAGGYVGYDHWRDSRFTAFQQVQSAGQRILISEFGEDADTIIAVDPNDTSDRTTIATIEHAEGYGIFATLSPDGSAIAYTALPPDSPRLAPDAPAQAAIVEADGDVTLLADDVDLLIAPVWSPDGASIVVRKNTPEEDGAGRFELIALARDGTRETITTWSSAAVFPIAFAPDGSALYFATLNESGTDLYRIAPDGTDETLIAHLSDEIARDWKLSSDGARMAYTVAESGENPRLAAMTIDLATGGITAAKKPRGLLTEQFSGAWSPDGELAVTSVSEDGSRRALTIATPGEPSRMTVAGETLDVALGFAPDGSSLAVLAVEDATVSSAGASRLELIRRDGTRDRVSEQVDVMMVGWME